MKDNLTVTKTKVRIIDGKKYYYNILNLPKNDLKENDIKLVISDKKDDAFHVHYLDNSKLEIVKTFSTMNAVFAEEEYLKRFPEEDNLKLFYVIKEKEEEGEDSSKHVIYKYYKNYISYVEIEPISNTRYEAVKDNMESRVYYLPASREEDIDINDIMSDVFEDTLYFIGERDTVHSEAGIVHNDCEFIIDLEDDIFSYYLTYKIEYDDAEEAYYIKIDEIL